MFNVQDRTHGDLMQIGSKEMECWGKGIKTMQVQGLIQVFKQSLKTPKAVQEFVDYCGLEDTGYITLRRNIWSRKSFYLLEVK